MGHESTLKRSANKLDSLTAKQLAGLLAFENISFEITSQAYSSLIVGFNLTNLNEVFKAFGFW
jgi:hypothetical protein